MAEPLSDTHSKRDHLACCSSSSRAFCGSPCPLENNSWGPPSGFRGSPSLGQLPVAPWKHPEVQLRWQRCCHCYTIPASSASLVMTQRGREGSCPCPSPGILNTTGFPSPHSGLGCASLCPPLGNEPQLHFESSNVPSSRKPFPIALPPLGNNHYGLQRIVCPRHIQMWQAGGVKGSPPSTESILITAG